MSPKYSNDRNHEGAGRNTIVKVRGGVSPCYFETDDEPANCKSKPPSGWQDAASSRKYRCKKLHETISPHYGRDANRFARSSQPLRYPQPFYHSDPNSLRLSLRIVGK
jgi:hypothetical protein